MAWLGKVSLGNLDLAGAVNKFSESVKNIEKNFDSALGLEEKSESSDREASGLWPSSTDGKALFDSVTSFMGHRSVENVAEPSEKAESSGRSSSVKEQERISTDKESLPDAEQVAGPEEEKEEDDEERALEETSNEVEDKDEGQIDSHHVPEKSNDSTTEDVETNEPGNPLQQIGSSEGISEEVSQSEVAESSTDAVEQVQGNVSIEHDALQSATDLHEGDDEPKKEATPTEEVPVVQDEPSSDDQAGADEETSVSSSINIMEAESVRELSTDHVPAEIHSDQGALAPADFLSHGKNSPINAVEASTDANDLEVNTKEKHLSLERNAFDSVDYAAENEKLKMEIKMMEAALLGAARQAQAKADEIAKMMNENEQLKEDLKKKFSEAEIETLREEYHQRVSGLERKVYTLTRERDTLRREQSRKNDATALLKEKDEIINQVMAEGEELSKKQAQQESKIRKLRAQIREFEEEKKGLITKLQAEENKVESIKRDKAATEKYLQETIEKHQAELVAQKEHYTSALNAAKEAEALAEARANTEARTELESRLREAEERETTLVQELEELRKTLTRTEQQAVFREDMLRRDIDDLQKRYQASERRCEELITQVPESTRPLLRQIEAMQEATARKAEAWAGVERVLNSRLQEAEAKAATSEENERAMNERLSQTLSRVAVLEAQVSCLRAEQTQLTRSLEKERQRASENRQEYLAAQEAVASHEVRANQLEEEIKELRKKHRQELQEILAQKELMQQELERERTARSDLERSVHLETSSAADHVASTKQMRASSENGMISRKLSSASSISSMEESFFLQASLDPSDTSSERKYLAETTMTPYFLKSMTPSAFEATLRQKDGELASYMSRLASLESIRDSLAEELVKMTAQCEKLRAEAALVPSMKAELEALRRRHSAALELMGERDEELEELRADIVDLKEMYREQVNLLVNKIQIMGSVGAT